MRPSTWQIASGAWGRNYAKVFLDYDVMLMGPGDPGPFDATKYDGLRTKEYLGALNAFCHLARSGDHVLLRQGHRVVAFGVVANDVYEHHEAFDDVYGWDLQHTRRVRWQSHLTDELTALQNNGDIFGNRKQIPTFTRVNDPKVLDRVSHLFAKTRPGELVPLPPPPGPELSLEDFGEALFARGLSNDSVDRLLSTFRRQRRLAKWYEDGSRAGRKPSESEVVAHLVLPMLLALGWSEQLLAVEWRRVDLAAFADTPTTPDTCVLACEAKAPGSGLADDLKQAIGYVQGIGLTRCGRILLTEGTRFYMYSRASTGWSEMPTGYFNTGRLRLAHIIHTDTNPVDSILALSPTRLAR